MPSTSRIIFAKSLIARFVIVFFGFLQPALADEGAKEVGPSVCSVEIQMDGVIGPATVDELQRALKKKDEWNCNSLFVVINTPGGSLQSTRLIVEEILNSKVPVLCLVGPAGGHAGSAGAIILQACHLAGAVKTTNIGAATPILPGGKEMPKDLRNKMVNDTRSWVEGLAKLRGRNIKFARDIIEEAKAVTAEEAAKIKAIDVLVENRTEFLQWAQGKTVKVAGDSEYVVQTGPTKLLAHNLRYKVMELLMDPQTAYMMFMGSLGLLYFEITHPGMVVPGVVGAVGLVISLISLNKLEVQWGGLLLILLGIGFMIAEAFVASFGILGIGGTVSFIVGSLFLFDANITGKDIPLSLILPTSILLGLATMGIAYLAFSTRDVKESAAFDILVGEEAEVVVVGKNGMKGKVELKGETWNFKSSSALAEGDVVKVTGHKGFTLHVEKIG